MEEMRQGVDLIVATPHFYANKVSAHRFLSDRKFAVEQLQSCLAEIENPPQVRIGAEIYYFEGISRTDILDNLTIEGTNLLLIEMPFGQWEERHYQELKSLIRKRGYRVILAHVERYHRLQKEKEIWDAVMRLPLAKQMNAGSFIKDGFLDRKYRWALNFMKEHEEVLLGTDCHNMSSRQPNMAAGREAIEKALGAERLAQADALAQKLLQI